MTKYKRHLNHNRFNCAVNFLPGNCVFIMTLTHQNREG